MIELDYLEELKGIPAFQSKIQDKDFRSTLNSMEVMQINLGKLCNLACRHCHVDAGPNRTEVMSKEVLEACLRVYKENDFKVIDITGGAPEMNPNFKWFIEEATKICSHIIVRTNLVILLEEEYKNLLDFYAKNKIEVVCSLPYYRAKDTNRQRGEEVFERSIAVLEKLNDLGYGKDPELKLNLVYNPGGAFLPPEQKAMEFEYKKRIFDQFGIVFNNLFTITNNPTGRFYAFLKRSGNLEGYMNRLYNAFNANTLETMMCRNQISVRYDGKIYDCDFNQAIDFQVKDQYSIFDLVGKKINKREIQFGKHCYACTAGQGSSCGGATEG
jgi:radical SAM/Cys-rich protein